MSVMWRLRWQIFCMSGRNRWRGCVGCWSQIGNRDAWLLGAAKCGAGDMLAAWLAHDFLHIRQLNELHYAYWLENGRSLLCTLRR